MFPDIVGIYIISAFFVHCLLETMQSTVVIVMYMCIEFTDGMTCDCCSRDGGKITLTGRIMLVIRTGQVSIVMHHLSICMNSIG